METGLTILAFLILMSPLYLLCRAGTDYKRQQRGRRG
jgi:hypothetical protein